MNLYKNKLFDIVDDEPVINVIIVNTGVFNKLYKADTSDDKGKYKAQLQYCYYVGDYDSPLYNMEENERKLEACNLCFGSKNVSKHITKGLEDALAFYIKCQSTVERRTLEASILSCDSLSLNLTNMKSSSDTLSNLLNDFDKEISQSKMFSDKVDLFKQKQDLETSTLANNQKINDLITKASKLLESIYALRQQANKANEELDNKLNDFIIDEFILQKNLNE